MLKEISRFEWMIALSIVAVILGVIGAIRLADPPLDAKEIIAAEKQCRSNGLEPSYFIDEHYRSIRHIECEEESRTVYY